MSQQRENDGDNGEYQYREPVEPDLFFEVLDETEASLSKETSEVSELNSALQKFVRIRRHDEEAPTEEDFCQLVRIILPSWLRKVVVTGERWDKMTSSLAGTLYENDAARERIIRLWRRLADD